jgi:hypothetical protein
MAKKHAHSLWEEMRLGGRAGTGFSCDVLSNEQALANKGCMIFCLCDANRGWGRDKVCLVEDRMGCFLMKRWAKIIEKTAFFQQLYFYVSGNKKGLLYGFGRDTELLCYCIFSSVAGGGEVQFLRKTQQICDGSFQCLSPYYSLYLCRWYLSVGSRAASYQAVCQDISKYSLADLIKWDIRASMLVGNA